MNFISFFHNSRIFNFCFQVQNSLDAKASSIAVRLNLENFTLQVVDNGHGLTKDELDVIGER
jgi:DNA mismatch repair ATPase MutL